MNATARKMYAKRRVDARTRINLGVGVVVLGRGGQILMEHRSDDGLWGLPGGRVEPGESITSAAVREVKEETGLTVKIVRLLGVYSEPKGRIVRFPDNGDVRHKIDVLVEARIIRGKLTLSHESRALRFFPLSRLPKEICPPAAAPLADYRKGKTGVIR